MRKGINPEKFKNRKIEYKNHRVIIPVYIPKSEDAYFQNLFQIFKLSINSLLETIDEKQTAITIINNNCKPEVTSYIHKLKAQKKIDRHVQLTENLGKMLPVLSEIKGAFEELITIADADILYFSNWQEKTVEVFNAYNRVGVVSPVPAPQIAFYNNITLFSNLFLKKKKARIVSKESLNLFDESIEFKRELNNDYWRNEQYYLDKKGIKACIGAGHFIATYRSDVLRRLPYNKPKDIFIPGYENEYIDKPIDKLGYYRVSLCDTYAYHLGNSIPNWVDEHKFCKLKLMELNLKEETTFVFPYNIRKLIFRFLKATIYKK